MFNFKAGQRASLFYSPVQSRYYGKVCTIDLPLELRPKMLHKTMKAFIADNQDKMPQGLYEQIANDLAIIRAVSWGTYNQFGADGREPRKKLTNFRQYKTPLLTLFPTHQEIELAFDALEDAIECITERIGNEEYYYYPK